jgi:peptidoglycan/xylan/chitin deacetylase (PgdA/CDA1 family)
LPSLGGLLLVLSMPLAPLLGGCASRAPAPQPPAPPAVAKASPAPPLASAVASSRWPQAGGEVVARNQRLLIVRPAAGDTLEGLAARFLGSAERSWLIADANGVDRVQPGEPLLVPLQPLNPLGVHADRLQSVPILCYHRLGASSSKMQITPADFEAQMTWLVRNRFRVVRLGDLAAFLAGEQPLPRRAVVITFDDGYESVHRHAFPVLKKLGLPATVFVYTDFLGGGDALTWAQLQEMQASGLVDVQSHSKSHRNLVERRPGETDERHRAAIDVEMRVPRELLERRLPPLKVRHLAYPYGDADALVIDSAARHGFELAATVVPGGNPFYAQPLMLRRTMIFGDISLDQFKSKLQVDRPLPSP